MLNPFALPIHPIVNHFAIAALSLAWAFLLVRYATGDVKWDERSRLFELVGILALPPTIAAAFIDTRGFDFVIHPRADAPLIWHMTSGLVTSLVFAAHYLWRRRGERPAFLDVSIATSGMLALVATGLLAGELVYNS